ncbi:endonuclease domain-containing protein [bacterium]|nr:endonuclease domain-containing protein [bacterium]
MTPAENCLWLKLRIKQFNNLKFRRQHGIGPYIVDFYCPEKSLVIEIDGDVHGLEDQVVKDNFREEYLKKLGLRIIRYCNDDVLNNIDGVMEDLYQKVILEELPPVVPLTKGGH